MVDQHEEQSRNRLKLSAGFEIGHAAIDKEHEAIIVELNKCIDAQEAGNSIASLKQFYVFKDLLITHFSSEEEVMKAMGYHLLEEHSTQHVKAAENIFEIIEKYKLNDEVNDVLNTDLMTDLIELFLRHLAADDTSFKGYLQELKYQE